MALAVGTTAPDFSLVDTEGESRSLSDLGGRNLVIAFFPAAFSGVCDTEMCTFRDSLSELNDMDADVVGISVDARFTNKEFAQKHGLTFPILSDYGREAIKAYDVEFPNFAGMDGYTAATRSVFVVDKGGAISYVWEAPSPPIEPPYDEVKAAVKALS